ncbi:hypothetical protein [Jannaschia seohaensis]|uniref:NfeD-like partner-binding protein n=1 Tax=Jannaschia seohaensis TaxID=475081 RepID=A0A2Y9B941_9RHOB|nr:hypothetical protein [Jannaschia seohaensis]PWJ10926.1 hypothetical protein BCF38_12131 [Jannaschia seohaensis]SSA51527.1 hypothetical protein SAMN05421539_12131 [Jannaschia seohaensis]
MTAWWVWALAAVALGVVEVLAPSYLALGFAIGAGLIALGLLTGVLGALLGLAGGYGSGVILLLFAALSLGAWLTLRRVFGAPGGQVRTFEDDVND